MHGCFFQWNYSICILQ